MTITQEELKKLLHYDPDTGVFTWIKSGKRRRSCLTAGCKFMNKNSKKMYISIWACGKLYLSHRLAWLYMTGEFPSHQIDHINGDGLDNRIINLRNVTGFDNQRNMKIKSTNKSGICGVIWHKSAKKWMSSITVSNKHIHLGLYSNIFDAACARKNADIKYKFHINHGSDRPL